MKLLYGYQDVEHAIEGRFVDSIFCNGEFLYKISCDGEENSCIIAPVKMFAAKYDVYIDGFNTDGEWYNRIETLFAPTPEEAERKVRLRPNEKVHHIEFAD